MKKVENVFSAPKPHWVGDGFPAKTLFSYQGMGKRVSPFLLLDHAGPMSFSPSEHIRGVGEHPHRGFETVTIVYDGEVAHRDSTGEQGVIGPGDVQWMTAAKGILHEEFHSKAFAKSGGKLEMMQLWVNLPKRDKMNTPKYQEIAAAQIPSVILPGDKGALRIIAGELDGLKGPASTHSPILVADGEIKATARFTLPIADEWSALVIVREGKVKVNGQVVSKDQTIILSQSGEGLEVEALDDSKLLVLAGKPIDEPIVGYGPFVMNSDAEIKQAFTDFQTGKFGNLARI
ncbi:MAG: pirin family protein [Aliiglaciecola sp.]|uniref:pirin family protein n=1 Tax=Aliiglaciecola sp. TaxID=1872441 RepID=UPI00329A6E90